MALPPRRASPTAPAPTISLVATQKQLPKSRGARLPGCARRARASGQGALRLKLAGAIVLRESECWCAGAHELSFNTLAPAGRSPAA